MWALSGFLLQLLVAVFIFVFCHDLVALAGAEGKTATDAAHYLMITVLSLPIMTLVMAGSAALRAEGDAMRAMAVTFSSSVVSMLIDPLLIFDFGLGLDCAAIAINVVQGLSAMLSVYFVVKTHDLAGKISLADFRLLFIPFAAVTVPAILTQLSTPFGNYIITAVISGFGDGPVAGWAVIARLTVVTFGGIIGQNFGTLRFDRVK